jgi:hypothetical protein
MSYPGCQQLFQCAFINDTADFSAWARAVQATDAGMMFSMPLPKLSDAETAWVIQQVAEYIERQRQTSRQRAMPLSANQMETMQPYFPVSTLSPARLLVLSGERVGNPPFYGQLIQMGFEAVALPDFSHMAAITFVDTVVSHESFTNRLLFHELVHVVQYEKLGLAEFANKYVRGFLSGGSYEAIPLEMNAYQLDARFAEMPTSAFSVADEVQRWIRADRF